MNFIASRPFYLRPNVFTPAEVTILIKAFEACPMVSIEPGVYSTGGIKLKKGSPREIFSNLPRRIREKIFQLQDFGNTKYATKATTIIDQLQYAEYSKGCDRTWHIDGLFQDGGDPKASEYTHCNFTIVVQLSRKENYSGGLLEFFSYHNLGNKILDIGGVYIFPSVVWHRITKVKSGSRKSLSIFMGSLTPIMYEKG